MFIFVPQQYKTQNQTSRRRTVVLYVEGIWKISSESILFKFNTLGVHPHCNGKEPQGNSIGIICGKCYS